MNKIAIPGGRIFTGAIAANSREVEHCLYPAADLARRFSLCRPNWLYSFEDERCVKSPPQVAFQKLGTRTSEVTKGIEPSAWRSSTCSSDSCNTVSSIPRK